MPDTDAAKADLRRRMRDVRRSLRAGADLSERSRAVAVHLGAALVDRRHPVRRVLGYTAVPGEVLTDEVDAWCRSVGAEVVFVDPTPTAGVPVAASWPDVILVPGLAFDRTGARLGQGGGWYDRLLAERAAGCLAVGLAFEEQWVERVPTDLHDQQVDVVVTDLGVTWCCDRDHAAAG
ncbi:MAG: 5-formyltetrahydrofolate cyclo-ligase [Actinomycetota bacterium]